MQRQYVTFSFYRVRREWRFLEPQAKEQGKRELEECLAAFAQKFILLPYSTLGTRADSDLLLWCISYRLEDFEDMSSALRHTGFGKYLEPAYSYLSMTKRSIYIDKVNPEHIESRTQIKPGKYKYLFVYPFLKTREWYLLPQEARQAMMDEHIRIGNRTPSVKLNTTYSFGLDDQEFVVAFESDEPKDFLDLVMELRGSQGSKYTLRDTPIFTCIARPLRDLLALF